jgi:three-Cys-motif partner protein
LDTDSFFEESTEQSRVKAAIVRDYFWAWAKIVLKKQRGPIAYIDLFAGPGLYKDGTKSTPLLVLEKAIADADMRERLVTILNDAAPGNVRSLEAAIAGLPGIGKLKHQPDIDAGEVGDETARAFQKISLVPTLLFADPWGYKGLSLFLIGSFLKDWGCDCVFFFNYNRINPGLSNDSVKQHMDGLFGIDRAEQLRERVANLPPYEREPAIVEALCEALNGLGAKYVLPFCFKDDRGARTSHHLVFATKHPLGYGIMKDIMAKYSSEQHQGVASFGYCPASTIHPRLFELNRPLDDLEDMLLSDFAGRTLTTQQIYDVHNVGRPYTMKNYKAVLFKMEEKGLIQCEPRKRRVGTFADHVRVTFAKATAGRGTK